MAQHGRSKTSALCVGVHDDVFSIPVGVKKTLILQVLLFVASFPPCPPTSMLATYENPANKKERFFRTARHIPHDSNVEVGGKGGERARSGNYKR